MFVMNKNSMKKKKQTGTKKNSRNFPKFGNFPKFLSSDIFQRLSEKQRFSCLEHI